jgi:hypothetical protein
MMSPFTKCDCPLQNPTLADVHALADELERRVLKYKQLAEEFQRKAADSMAVADTLNRRVKQLRACGQCWQLPPGDPSRLLWQ